MAVEIQEPNDLPAGSITPDNENNYEVLVYQKQKMPQVSRDLV